MIFDKTTEPCEGEVSIKSYLCTKFDSRIFGIKAEGYLEVTNRRLLFQAKGRGINGWSVIHNEVAIADVSEIKIYKGSSFSIMKFILGFIVSNLIAAALVYIFNEMRLGNLFTALLILGGWGYIIYRAFLWARSEAFSLLINTKGGDGNVVYIAGLSPFAGGNSTAARALTAAPAKDSELMLKEIGALILDVQNMGENAIEKWQGKIGA